MPIETATYISDLNENYPQGSDSRATSDNHHRLTKSVLKNSFANIAGPVTATHTELNYVDGVTSAIQTQLDARPTSATLAGSGGSALVGFIQSGTGAVARTEQAKLRETKTPYDFGAAGDNSTDDTTAIQAFVDAVVSGSYNGDWGDGYYKITSPIVITPTTGVWFNFKGRGIRSVVRQYTDGVDGITISATGIGSLNFCSLGNFMLYGPSTTNAASIGIRITGDSGLFQHAIFHDMLIYQFYAAFKDEKTANSTAFGDSAALNWMHFSRLKLISQYKYGFWFTQGSGTGNVFSDIRTITSSAGSSHFFFDGSSCVVGDVVFKGVHAGCSDAVTGSNLIEIGASTLYRAQWDLSGCQMDANCNVPVKMSATGATEYVNWNIQSNNLGGTTTMGSGLQPLSRSVVQDRDVSRWEAGIHYTTNSTGAQTLDCFLLDFANYGAAYVKVTAYGVVSGVTAAASEYEFEIRADTANAVGQEMAHALGYTGQLTWTYTDLGSKQGKFTLAFTPSSTGTAIEATIHARGKGFKVTRSITS